MFTRNRLPPFQPSGDWRRDGPLLHKWLQDYFRSLETPSALTITEATIDSTPIGDDDPSTGVFTIGVFGTLSATALSVEGTSWTPTITAATPGDLSVSFAAGVRIGERIAIGGFEVAFFRLTTSTFTHTTAAGDLQITGLTRTAATLSNMAWAVSSLEFSNLTKAGYTQFTPRVASNDNKILIRASGSGSAVANVQITDLATGGTVILNGAVIYRAA